MFFKKKPKKTWLEMELERERKNAVRHVNISIDDGKMPDELVDALCKVGCVNVVTANELQNLAATTIDASKIEATTLTIDPNQIRAMFYLPPIKEV